MEELKKNLNAYQLMIDRAEFFQNQEKFQDSLKYYNSALNHLLYAKELCQYSDELLETTKQNKQFKTWLADKKRSIESQLNSLAKFVKNLEKSLEFVKEVSSPENTPKKHRRRRRKSNKNVTMQEDDWKQLAGDTIKLLCHLRAKYDFKSKNRIFEKILQRQSNLMRKD